MFYQQGDLLIKAVEKIQGEKVSSMVLLEGEMTGHMHRIEGDALVYEYEGKKYFTNNEPVVIEHDEHEPIKIEAGSWEVGQVQEKDHFAKESVRPRGVID